MKTFEDLRIIYMGTPEFAVASLDALRKAGANIVAVVTGPDKPAGRGMKLQQSAVKKYAVENDIPVLQPEKLKNPEFIEILRSYKADLQVVVAFRMLPEIIWNMPTLGTINLHGSLLPQYRGAAPINWAVINGEKETGVTTFQLKHDIDTGDMLMQTRFPIEENDTAGTVHDKMMMIGAETLVETVKALANNTTNPQPQTHSETLHSAPKIYTETCQINWNQPLDVVYNLIRGLSPYPGAYTIIEGKIFKIFEAAKEEKNVVEQPGTIISDNKSYLKFACQNGYINALMIQPAGKRRMTTTDYLRGHQIKN